MFNVNADLFRITAIFQSVEATRYYICGVHIEPHPVRGVLMIATDGHSAFVAHDESGQCDRPVTVALDRTALAACASGRGETEFRRLTGDDELEPAWIRRGELKMHAALKWSVEGNFPTWRRVMPAVGENPVNPVFDAARLSVFTKAAMMLRPKQTAPIRVETYGTGAPSIIRFAGAPHVFGVLTPNKMDGRDTGLPAFMADAAAVAA